MKRSLLVLALVAVAVSPATGNASTKTANLYFANTGSCGTTNPTFALVSLPSDAGECSTSTVVNGMGLTANDTYSSSKKLSLKVDVSRPVTGTIFVSSEPPAKVGGMPGPIVGYVDMTVTISIEKIKVGTVTVTGPITPPALAQAFSFPMPASLKGKTIHKVAAVAHWTTTIGVVAVSYSAPAASVMSIPTR